MSTLPLQDEPESTIGRKPRRGFEHREPEEGTPVRSGAAIRREEGDETEAGSEIRERERDEPPPVQDLEE
jgi:hypothetical protein